MLPDLTPAVARALNASQQRAFLAGASAVQPLHLLQALLDESEGRAAMLVRNARADDHCFRQTFALLEHSDSDADPESLPPLGQQIETILRVARRLTTDLALGRTVGSETVLLALLQEEESLRCLLEEYGLVFAQLENAVRALQGPPLQLDEPLQLTEPTEPVDTLRILDAAANRAREAVRVIEDYCRFVLDDSFLSGECKRIRHDLAHALADVASNSRLAARETLRDVGTHLSTPDEYHRHSLRDVAQINLKRLQEALRSLEEFVKLQCPNLGPRMESLRYRSYTLERMIVLGADARHRLAEARLYVLLTGSLCKASLDWTIQEAAAGGATIFQLREKSLDDRKLLERARQVRRWTQQTGTLFIMNDRPDIARLVEADGVHLGQEDLPIKEARRILGPDAIIGVSTHDLTQVRQALCDGASYIGVGPAFPSTTKSFSTLAGLDFIRQATAETSLPAFVLGGINLTTIEAATAAGAKRIAVSQAIVQADNPKTIASELLCRLMQRSP